MIESGLNVLKTRHNKANSLGYKFCCAPFVPVICSVDITPAPDGTGTEVSIKQADMAMYDANEEGRNNYHVFDREKA